MRTINACSESFHSKLNEMFYYSYPNIIQILEILKNIQTDIYIKMPSTNLANKRIEDTEKKKILLKILRFSLKQIIYHVCCSFEN